MVTGKLLRLVVIVDERVRSSFRGFGMLRKETKILALHTAAEPAVLLAVKILVS